jgi:iron-sulfur cluster assembly protein
MTEVNVTEEAAVFLKKSLMGKPEMVGVRLGVKSSGCSGLSYFLELVKTLQPEDKVFQQHGINLVVDEKGLPYLKGTEITWVQEGLNEYLKFNNPRATGTCGCGESFTIEKE